MSWSRNLEEARLWTGRNHGGATVPEKGFRPRSAGREFPVFGSPGFEKGATSNDENPIPQGPPCQADPLVRQHPAPLLSMGPSGLPGPRRGACWLGPERSWLEGCCVTARSPRSAVFSGSRPGPRSKLLQLNQGVVGLHRVHGLDVNRLDHPVPGGADTLLHFHGFHHAHLIAL